MIGDYCPVVEIRKAVLNGASFYVVHSPRRCATLVSPFAAVSWTEKVVSSTLR